MNNEQKLSFSWDPDKAAANEQKHNVSFDEALTVFTDGSGLIVADPDHSWGEDRWILLGMGWSMRVLAVSYCYREAGQKVRIISARKANRSERSTYGRKRNAQ